MEHEVKTEHEKTAVAFLEEVVAGNIHDAYVKYVRQGMQHHNPFFPGDAGSLEKGMMQNAEEFPVKAIDIKHVLEEDDFVAVHSHVMLRDDSRGMSTVHLFRFEGNKIAEFWDIAQEVPANSPNANGMF